MFLILLKILSIIISLLISVAYFTIAERKIMGSIQKRRGPNVIGVLGLLQPIADGLKLFVKETTMPTNANKKLFLMAPSMAFLLSLISWIVIPFSPNLVLCDLYLGIIYLLAISSLNVFGVLFAGWSSNSKYAYLGALRSAAQMISYEISIGFTMLNIAICAGSFNLYQIVISQTIIWYLVPLLPIFIIFCISMLAETNRHPFDLPEAEAELVSGYNVEYSAMTFALFFLGEYANMLLMSALTTTVFLGGWLFLDNYDFLTIIPDIIFVCLKILFGAVIFIITRATLPRYRYNQLMNIGWKCFLPLSISYFILIIGTLFSLNGLAHKTQISYFGADERSVATNCIIAAKNAVLDYSLWAWDTTQYLINLVYVLLDPSLRKDMYGSVWDFTVEEIQYQRELAKHLAIVLHQGDLNIGPDTITLYPSEKKIVLYQTLASGVKENIPQEILDEIQIIKEIKWKNIYTEKLLMLKPKE